MAYSEKIQFVLEKIAVALDIFTGDSQQVEIKYNTHDAQYTIIIPKNKFAAKAKDILTSALLDAGLSSLGGNITGRTMEDGTIAFGFTAPSNMELSSIDEKLKEALNQIKGEVNYNLLIRGQAMADEGAKNRTAQLVQSHLQRLMENTPQPNVGVGKS
jgi:hypothetical protein